MTFEKIRQVAKAHAQHLENHGVAIRMMADNELDAGMFHGVDDCCGFSER